MTDPMRAPGTQPEERAACDPGVWHKDGPLAQVRWMAEWADRGRTGNGIGPETAGKIAKNLRAAADALERRESDTRCDTAAPSDGARWLTQTKRGGGHAPPEERGDCVPACIASVLGLPIDAIANTHGEGWWDRLNSECAKHGYCLGLLDVKMVPPAGYWIASVPSLNLPPDPDGREAWHSVVARGYELVHDPSIGTRYDEALWTQAWNDDKVVEGWVLIAFDSPRLLAEARAEERAATLRESQSWLQDELRRALSEGNADHGAIRRLEQRFAAHNPEAE